METKATHVVTWGASMVLADFFKIVPVQWSTTSVAIRYEKSEYGEFGNEKCIPTADIRTDAVYPVRIKDWSVQIKFPSSWMTAEVWNGSPVRIDTLD